MLERKPYALTSCMPSRDKKSSHAVTQSALVMPRIGTDRCGPLMTMVVP
jgi:hypothetical protein